MADVMLDARQQRGSYRRIEVITGLRQRRRWTAQEKAWIVAESFEEGANFSAVARRNGVAQGLLTVRRHKLAAAAGDNAPGFVPIRIASEGSPRRRASRAVLRLCARCQFRGEIEISGARIPVERGVDLTTLTTSQRR